MRESALEGISFCLVLVLAACADGLADCSGGMVALLVGGFSCPVFPCSWHVWEGQATAEGGPEGRIRQGKPARAGGFWAKRKPLRW